MTIDDLTPTADRVRLLLPRLRISSPPASLTAELRNPRVARVLYGLLWVAARRVLPHGFEPERTGLFLGERAASGALAGVDNPVRRDAEGLLRLVLGERRLWPLTGAVADETFSALLGLVLETCRDDGQDLDEILEDTRVRVVSYETWLGAPSPDPSSPLVAQRLPDLDLPFPADLLDFLSADSGEPETGNMLAFERYTPRWTRFVDRYHRKRGEQVWRTPRTVLGTVVVEKALHGRSVSAPIETAVEEQGVPAANELLERTFLLAMHSRFEDEHPLSEVTSFALRVADSTARPKPPYLVVEAILREVLGEHHLSAWDVDPMTRNAVRFAAFLLCARENALLEEEIALLVACAEWHAAKDGVPLVFRRSS